MAVTLSLFAGVGAQFLDNNGVPLSGGKVYSYAAGTTTLQQTYTTNTGAVPHTNPIVLDAAGRVPSGEIWLTVGVSYKFLLKTADDVQIASYDNVPSAPQPPIANEASFIAYEQGYAVNAPNLIAGKLYRIVTTGTTDFTTVGALSNTVGTLFIATGPATGSGTAAFSRTVQTRLRDTVSVKDFGAVGDGVTDDTASIQAALNYGGYVFIPDGTYLLSTKVTIGLETSFLQIGSDTQLFGSRKAVLKVAPNVGDYTAVITALDAVGTPSTNIVMSGFTIDQDAANNTTCNITPGVLARVGAAILMHRQNLHVYVEGMAFLNAPGVNTISINSPNSTDVRVNNNEFSFLVGTSTTPLYDNSVVYITANGFQCNDNWVYNSTGANGSNYSGGVTGLELHGANGQVCRNQIFRFAYAMNIVGFTSTQAITQLNNLVINENVASDCGSGIAIWPLTTAGLRGYEINDNLLHLDPTKFAVTPSTLFGISMTYSAGVTGPAEYGNILNNIIKYDGNIQSATPASFSAGIQIVTEAPVSNLKIKNNSIYNAPNTAIRISQVVGAFDLIDVSDNFIYGAGLNALTTARFGIFWTGLVTRSRCVNNFIVDTSTGAPHLVNGVSSNLLTAGSSLLADYNYNQISGTTVLRNQYAASTQASRTQTLTTSGSALITFTPSQGFDDFTLDCNTTSGFTLTIDAALYPAPTGKTVSVQIINTSGGTTAVTFSANFVFATPFVQLTTGKRCRMNFTFDGAAAKWYQSSPQITVTS